MRHVSTPGVMALWPPDDTEESIMGVDRHQLDIITLRTGINEEAERVAQGGTLPWQAVSQVLFLGCETPDGTAYRVMPDVMVFPRPMNQTRGSYNLQQDGAPLLIVEVASESTYEADLDRVRGKAWSYERAGVAEYLVLDPTRRWVPSLGQGWRLDAGVYVPWLPDGQGRWQSQQVRVAIGVDRGLAAVYGAGGHRHLREREVGAALATQRTEGFNDGRAEGFNDGRAEGRSQGALEGKRETLRQLVRLRFGQLAAVEQRIDLADTSELDRMLTRLLTATGPGDL